MDADLGSAQQILLQRLGKFEKCYHVDREIMILMLDRENHRFGREFGILNLGLHCILKLFRGCKKVELVISLAYISEFLLKKVINCH